MNFWSWSLYLFRFRGIEVRAHWTLLLIAIYDLRRYSGIGMPWWLAPAFVALLLLSILLHEFGHAFAARAVGGRSNRIVLWMLGGLAECEQPMRPWPHFAVAAGGPLVTGVLCALGWLCYQHVPMPGSPQAAAALTMLAHYLFWLNGRLLLLNLLPCYPLDGSRMLTAALWPWVGARNASLSALWMSYPCAFGLFAWSVWQDSMIGVGLSIWIFSELIQQHALTRMGGVNVFGIDHETSWTNRQNRSGNWFSRWRMRRRQRIAEHREREENAEQQLVDDLLAKVGATGLTSLSKQERAILESYSRKQRERQLIGRD
jgi:Zn-dependent protease